MKSVVNVKGKVATNIRWKVAAVFFSLLAFVVYGSLVPLEFNQLSFSDALLQFVVLDKTDIAITQTNRADWFTNFLLMMPVLYSAMLLQSHKGLSLSSLVYAAGVMSSLLIVSFGIEFTQLFIEQRISSFRDIYTQCLGMLLALGLFYSTRERVHNTLLKLSTSSQLDKWEVYGISLLSILFIYSLMPFDLTLSFTELFKKWASGKISLIPFYNKTLTPLQLIFNGLMDIIIWITITFCFIKSRRYSAPKLVAFLFSTALIIEVAQLPVLSRYSDVTDLITALIGVFVALRLFSTKGAYTEPLTNNRLTTIAFVSILYYAGLLFFYTLPFELVSKSELAIKFNNFFSFPFLAYWQDAPYNAVTQLVRKILLFVPLGILLHLFLSKNSARKSDETQSLLLLDPKISNAFILFLFVAMIISLELMQLPIANKVASISDTLLNLLGFFIGKQAFRFHNQDATNCHVDQSAKIKSKWVIDWKWGYLLCIVSSFLFCLFLLALDATPYNVKELFDKFPPIVSALLVAVMLASVIFYPILFANSCLNRQRLEFSHLIKHILTLAALIIMLSLIIFPNEAVHDVVGFPKWAAIPQWIESSYRLFGLILPFVYLYLFITSTNLLKGRVDKELNFYLKLITFFSLVVLPFSFAVAVVQAVTDNLTELLSGGGYSFGMLGVIAYISLLLYFASSYRRLSLSSFSKKAISYAIAICFSAPVSYWLIQLTLVDYIFKYEVIFTPLQFLLSPDRENLYSVESTKNIFYGVHYFALILFTFNFYVQNYFVRAKAAYIDAPQE